MRSNGQLLDCRTRKQSFITSTNWRCTYIPLQTPESTTVAQNVAETSAPDLARGGFQTAADSGGLINLCLRDRREPIGAVSLLFRYGENSGDSTHAEPHFRTSCHYQIFF